MSQKEVVYQVICGFIKDQSLKFDGKVELTKSQKLSVVGIMVELTQQGSVEIKSDKESGNPHKYWVGCVNNWLRKDIRLNGGEKYKPTYKKGSRVSSEVKELKKLLDAVKLGNDQEVIDAVELELNLAIQNDESKKKPEIDKSFLPESLKHLV